MAVPKRRKSNRKTGTKRAHHALKPTRQIVCTNCGRPKLGHKVCEHCHFYKGRQILQVAEKTPQPE